MDFESVLLNNTIMKKISELKKGSLFKFIGNETIWIFEGYCRMNKGYQCTQYADTARFKYIKDKTLLIYEI